MNNSHIPTEEILKDISDTQYEIKQMKQDIEAFKLLGDKMSLFKIDHRINGIKEREIFIDKLNKIIEERLKCS